MKAGIMVPVVPVIFCFISIHRVISVLAELTWRLTCIVYPQVR